MHVLFFPASKNVLFFTSFGSGLNGCTFRWLWTRSVLNPKTAKQWCSLDTNKLLSIWKLPSPSLWWNTIIHQSRVPPKNTEAAIRGMNLVEKALVEPWPWSSSTYRRSACGQNRRNLDVEMKKKKQKTWEISRDCNRLKAELCGFSNFSKRGVEEPLIDALIRWQWFGHREKSRRFIQMAINQ